MERAKRAGQRRRQLGSRPLAFPGGPWQEPWNQGVVLEHYRKIQRQFTDKLCPWPFERAFVSSDSRTVPCCIIGNPDAYELGKGKSFLETWNSDEYVAFRQAHLDGNLPKICQFWLLS
jgi:hypothetical protein